MVAHEFLVDCIRDRPLRFFSDEFRDRPSIPSEAYKAKVLALDPKNKLYAWRGGIEWLKRMDVIDETDEIVIQEVRKVRNVMAHELRNIIGGGSMPEVGEYLPKLLELIKKIERWWIVNVELPTNPDLDGQDVGEGEIISGPEMVINILCDVATGNEEKAWAYYKHWLASRAPSADGA